LSGDHKNGATAAVCEIKGVGFPWLIVDDEEIELFAIDAHAGAWNNRVVAAIEAGLAIDGDLVKVTNLKSGDGLGGLWNDVRYIIEDKCKPGISIS
jgi:hypothetical protein